MNRSAQSARAMFSQASEDMVCYENDAIGAQHLQLAPSQGQFTAQVDMDSARNSDARSQPSSQSRQKPRSVTAKVVKTSGPNNRGDYYGSTAGRQIDCQEIENQFNIGVVNHNSSSSDEDTSRNQDGRNQ